MMGTVGCTESVLLAHLIQFISLMQHDRDDECLMSDSQTPPIHVAVHILASADEPVPVPVHVLLC